MQIKQIINYLEKWCPLQNALTFDPTGWQIGETKQEVKNILISLDCSNITIKKAIENQCNLIITHHPLFWPDKTTGLTENVEQQKKAKKLKKAKIIVYSLHTNYDEKYLKQQLLQEVALKNKVIHNKNLIIFAELLNNISMRSFINKIKKKWKLPNIQYWTNDLKIKIKTIAVIPGAGGFALQDCIDQKVDLIITGELKWSDWIFCRDYQQKIITVGHHTEQLFIKKVAQWLKKIPKWNKKTKIILHYEKNVEVG